jgi:hypothetical protein
MVDKVSNNFEHYYWTFYYYNCIVMIIVTWDPIQEHKESAVC